MRFFFTPKPDRLYVEARSSILTRRQEPFGQLELRVRPTSATSADWSTPTAPASPRAEHPRWLRHVGERALPDLPDWAVPPASGRTASCRAESFRL